MRIFARTVVPLGVLGLTLSGLVSPAAFAEPSEPGSAASVESGTSGAIVRQGTAARAVKPNVRVRIQTSEEIPAIVVLRGKSKSLVLAKPPTGTNAQLRGRIAPGLYRVVVRPTAYKGRLFVGSTNTKSVRIGPKRPVALSVRFTEMSGPSDLRVVSAGQEAITLEWAMKGDVPVFLRRQEGFVPPARVDQGLPVQVDDTSATDVGLKPATTYSYSLFAKVGNQFSEPLSLTLSTKAVAGSEAAEFVTTMGTVIFDGEDAAQAKTGPDGVTVSWPSEYPLPQLGSVVVLPISSSVPTGFLGKVAGIASDGKTVKLISAALEEGFAKYEIPEVEYEAEVPLEVLSDSGASGVASDRVLPRALPRCPLSYSAGVGITPRPSLKFRGTFDADLDTGADWVWGIPKPYAVATIKSRIEATVTLAADVEFSGATSCSVPLGAPAPIPLGALGPVPFVLVFESSLSVQVAGSVKLENVGMSATTGFWVSARLDSRTGPDIGGGPIVSASPLTPTVSAMGDVTIDFGGRATVGPGGGTGLAGGVAGLSAGWSIIKAKAGAVFSQEDARYELCLKAEASSELTPSLYAKAWVASWDWAVEYPIEALKGERQLGGPWYFPADCINRPLPPEPTKDLAGPGVKIDDEVVGGTPEQWDRVPGIVPGEVSWILSTGNASSVAGSPEDFASEDLGGLGNSLLSDLAGYETRDAVFFRASVIPTGKKLYIRYAFASEEYPDYVGSQYNDVMGIFVNGSNCAIVGSAPVSVNTINQFENSDLYVDNSMGQSGYQTSMNGLTVPMTCSIDVSPGKPVQIEIAVADASDGVYDSAVALLDRGIWSE